MSTPHACWVILIGSVPTSFRARTREDLVPTFRQLQRTQPEVTLRWFERGRVWESPEAARAAATLALTEARERRRRRPDDRGNDWRPGGDHRDPKARFELTRDQKRAKFKRNLGREAVGGEPGAPAGKRAGGEPGAPAVSRPAGDPFAGSKRTNSTERPKTRRIGPKDPFGRD